MATQPPQGSIPTSELFPEGFLALRTGLFEHLQSGRMTAAMLPIYVVLLHQANWQTGVWNGNAHRIYHALGGTQDLSSIRKNLAKLCRQLYVKSFHFQGNRGNYYVLLNRYKPSLGELKGKVLNAEKSASWKNPVYEHESEEEVSVLSQGSDEDVRRMSKGSERPPYQDIQDGQDFENVQESEDLTTSPTSDEEPNGKTLVTEVADGHSSNDLGHDEFMAALDHILEGSYFDKTTKPHREKAYSLARQHGTNPFLAALEYWLYNAAKYDCSLGEEDSGPARTWALNYFLESGKAINYMERVRSWAHLVRGDALAIVMGIVDENPDFTLTSGQVTGLEAMLKEYGRRRVAHMLGMVDDNMQEFLDRHDELDKQYTEELRGRTSHRSLPG